MKRTELIEQLPLIKVYDEIIRNKLQEIDNLRDIALKITASTDGDRVKTSGRSDKVGNAIIAIVDLQNELNNDVDRLIDLKRNCIKEIDTIEDKLLVGILYGRYFRFMTWEAIADELFVTRQWVIEKHKRFTNSC